MFFLEIIIAFSLFWGIGGLIGLLVYWAIRRDLEIRRDNPKPATHCCAEEGYCERCEGSTMDWKKAKELADKMGGKEIISHGISATPCGYTPPKEEEQVPLYKDELLRQCEDAPVITVGPVIGPTPPKKEEQG